MECSHNTRLTSIYVEINTPPRRAHPNRWRRRKSREHRSYSRRNRSCPASGLTSCYIHRAPFRSVVGTKTWMPSYFDVYCQPKRHNVPCGASPAPPPSRCNLLRPPSCITSDTLLLAAPRVDVPGSENVPEIEKVYVATDVRVSRVPTPLSLSSLARCTPAFTR